MDWKRIKTILIFALIIINGLLIWTLFEENYQKIPHAIERDFLLELVSEKNIVLDEKLLDVNKAINNIKMRVQSYDTAVVENVFLKMDYESENFVDPKLNQTLSRLTYEIDYGDEQSLTQTFMSDDEFLKQTFDLLDSLNINTDDVLLKSIGQTGKKTILQFEQQYDGFVIKDSVLEIEYNNKNLIGFNRIWYDIIESTKPQSTLFTTEYALFKFLGDVYDNNPERDQQLIIEDIQLVYKIDQEISGPSIVALEGEASIFYEIETSEGEFLIGDE